MKIHPESISIYKDIIKSDYPIFKHKINIRLLLDYTPKDISEWLASKYTNVSEKKFVISELAIKSFKNNYLDVYNMIKKILLKLNNLLR